LTGFVVRPDDTIRDCYGSVKSIAEMPQLRYLRFQNYKILE